MKRTAHFYFLILLIFTYCQCTQKTDLSSGSKIDLAPKTPQFASAPPNALTMLLDYDDGRLSLVETRLRNTAISTTDTDVTDEEVINGEAKIFDFKVFTKNSKLIFDKRIRVRAKMRSNYPDNNGRILHESKILRKFNFPVSIAYEKDALPSTVIIREFLVGDGKIDSTMTNKIKALNARSFELKIDSIIK